MKIIIGDVNFYKLDFDTEDLVEARKKAIEWLYSASGDDRINKSNGCEVVQELDNGILVKIDINLGVSSTKLRLKNKFYEIK